jgi:DNA-binding phage protein
VGGVLWDGWALDGGALYKALSPSGDPRLSTLVGVMKAMGIKIRPIAA